MSGLDSLYALKTTVTIETCRYILYEYVRTFSPCMHDVKEPFCFLLTICLCSYFDFILHYRFHMHI